jgi:hypothetical protein
MTESSCLVMGGVPASLPLPSSEKSKPNNDGFTLSQLTKLFNNYRREFEIRCVDQADWKRKRDQWTRSRYIPNGVFRDENGTGRAQPVYVPKI